MAATHANKHTSELKLTWSPKELRFLDKLSTPYKIQEFLDRIPYRVEDDYCSPRQVIADRRAHCFDGALLAYAALERLRYVPRLLDLRAVEDDDHVIAVFRRGSHWGAIAKSNFPGLRWREPVYRTIRELAMSYFESYFNLRRKRTLRAYSLPMSLTRFDDDHWMFRADCLERIARALDERRHVSLLTPSQERNLTPVDKRSLQSSLVGLNRAGSY